MIQSSTVAKASEARRWSKARYPAKLRLDRPGEADTAWRIVSLDAAPDYPAAVAAAGQDWRAVVGDGEREAVSVR
jgi:hypothetical protein